MNPTQSDINTAKVYIRQRLEAELRMEHYLDSALLKAARQIVEIAYKWSIPPTLFSFSYDPFLSGEVDKVLARLLAQIEEYDVALAASTPKADKESLVPYIYREIDGITYSERLNHYTSRFKLELQDFIAAALAAGIAKDALVSIVRTSYKQPYKGTIIADREHYGASAYTRLLLLTRHTIADAWMHADMEQAIRRGATGFITFRGSNYPCQLCDDNANRFHTFAEPYPPYHPRCVCYAVPVFNKME